MILSLQINVLDEEIGAEDTGRFIINFCAVSAPR